ncbi:hypothetical protein LGM43_37035, partial [Burkholderia seminalis]|uniref:hypothetical protein n=1 Tax=Burkholderia seminalis TaxID=488731 RepID=UPI001CF142B3
QYAEMESRASTNPENLDSDKDGYAKQSKNPRRVDVAEKQKTPVAQGATTVTEQGSVASINDDMNSGAGIETREGASPHSENLLYYAEKILMDMSDDINIDQNFLTSLSSQAGKIKSDYFFPDWYKPLDKDAITLIAAAEIVDSNKKPNDNKNNSSNALDLKKKMRAYDNENSSVRSALENEGQRVEFQEINVIINPSMRGERAHLHMLGKLRQIITGYNSKNINYKITDADYKTKEKKPNDFENAKHKENIGTKIFPKEHLNHVIAGHIVNRGSSAAHELILQDRLSKIDRQRLERIENAIAVTPGLKGRESKAKVAIWIRNQNNANGHSDAQNTTKERFLSIINSIGKANINDIIIIGDENKETNEWIDKSKWKKEGNDKVVTWLTGIWQQSANNKNGVGMLYSLDKSENIETRGNNDEQVAVYDALYERHNMMAIITNKSGGPDLPSLSGIPQITLSEMDPSELDSGHRLGFMSLVSHAYTNVRLDKNSHKENHGALSDQEQSKLTDMIRRSKQVRDQDLEQRKKIRSQANKAETDDAPSSQGASANH